MNSPKYRPEIDGLRAIAVLGVVLFHFNLFPLSGGFTGVDTFFVISGFLITQNICTGISNGTFSFLDFYIRRARRLFPALLFTWIFTMSLGFLLFTPEHYLRLSKSLSSSVLSFSNIFFWLEAGYFDTSISFKPLLHTWSLSVEEQFYIFWPITLFFILRLKNSKSHIVLISLLGLVSLFFAQHWLSVDPVAAFFLTPFRVIEFSIGALLVFLIQFKPKDRFTLEALMIAGLSCIGYAFVTFSKNTPFPGFTALLPCIGSALLIYSGSAKYTGKILRNPLSIQIGLISYSLYLLHWPVIIFYKYWKYTDVSFSEKTILLPITLLLAYFSYRYIEQPFRKGKLLLTVKRQKIFAASCIPIAACLLIFSGITINNNGFPQRIGSKFSATTGEEGIFHETSYGGLGYNYERSFGDEKRQGTKQFDVLLMGDSFARHYAAGLDPLFKQENLMAINMTMIACFLGPDITSCKDGILKEQCRVPYNKSLSLLQDNNKPVILTQAWEWYYTGICDPEGKPLKFATRREYGEFLIQNMNKIKKEIGWERDLIIIGNSPGSGNDKGIRSCVDRPRFLPNNCLDQLLFKREKGQGYDLNKQLKEYAESTDNTYFFDPFDVFCDDEYCHSVDYTDNLIWYSDVGHLSVDGSNLVAQHFIKEIVAIIKKNH